MHSKFKITPSKKSVHKSLKSSKPTNSLVKVQVLCFSNKRLLFSFILSLMSFPTCVCAEPAAPGAEGLCGDQEADVQVRDKRQSRCQLQGGRLILNENSNH